MFTSHRPPQSVCCSRAHAGVCVCAWVSECMCQFVWCHGNSPFVQHALPHSAHVIGHEGTAVFTLSLHVKYRFLLLGGAKQFATCCSPDWEQIQTRLLWAPADERLWIVIMSEGSAFCWCWVFQNHGQLSSGEIHFKRSSVLLWACREVSDDYYHSMALWGTVPYKIVHHMDSISV